MIVSGGLQVVAAISKLPADAKDKPSRPVRVTAVFLPCTPLLHLAGVLIETMRECQHNDSLC